ncbi:hypothetical protein KCP70_00200 [Salmonella enterica subsp. enterica]|nr:hypothetical protein KCP70_00200 [Salmonella enterica subsp. enterica]
MRYTIQKFYRVNGGGTQRKGVTPDIIMPTGNEEGTETGEKNLKTTPCRGIALMKYVEIRTIWPRLARNY